MHSSISVFGPIRMSTQLLKAGQLAWASALIQLCAKSMHPAPKTGATFGQKRIDAPLFYIDALGDTDTGLICIWIFWPDPWYKYSPNTPISSITLLHQFRELEGEFR